MTDAVRIKRNKKGIQGTLTRPKHYHTLPTQNVVCVFETGHQLARDTRKHILALKVLNF